MSLLTLICPASLSVDILSQWGELKDLTKVDSAFCNQTERGMILKLFQAPGFVCTSLVSHNQLKYVNVRGLKVCGVDLVQSENSSLSRRDINDLIQLNNSKIHTLKFKQEHYSVFC